MKGSENKPNRAVMTAAKVPLNSKGDKVDFFPDPSLSGARCANFDPIGEGLFATLAGISLKRISHGQLLSTVFVVTRVMPLTKKCVARDALRQTVRQDFGHGELRHRQSHTRLV
ncbi:hypothetical protein AVEN_270261-1 [Araneus ventricosus]|uniref:Uncharacterized protein n=1 Tax=Araneus ventricosus TaxID=182803 RepID=A0A4Y2NGI0_ARAVE|nr:hypothetical protein AVEN_270261-1 [Araneus ventricosus]